MGEDLGIWNESKELRAGFSLSGILYWPVHYRTGYCPISYNDLILNPLKTAFRADFGSWQGI
jgi:hypothetical protein